MGEKRLKVKEVAALLGETENVVRNWVKDFRQYIPLEKADNGYNLFNEPAVGALRTIQRLHRDQNYSLRQVEYYLASGGTAFAPAEQPAEVAAAAEIGQLREDMRQMMQLLTQKLDEQQAYIERVINERDKQLTETLRLLQANRQLEGEKAKRRPWWKFSRRE